MRKSLIILPLAATLLLPACSNNDDTVMQWHDPTVFFIPSDTATDSTSVLRREFNSTHPSYLLFNDTIQLADAGIDPNGDEIYSYETLDLDYQLREQRSKIKKYYYTYLTDFDDQKDAVNYLETYILPHFDDKATPFSWLLIGTIRYRDNLNHDLTSLAVSGQRGIALACSNLKRMKTDRLRQQLAKRHLTVILGKIASDNQDAFNDMFNVSSGWYNMQIPSSVDKDDWLKSHGFLGAYSQLAGYAPSHADDLSQYANLVVNYTEAQIESRYAKYPLVIEKFKIAIRVFKEIGVNL